MTARNRVLRIVRSSALAGSCVLLLTGCEVTNPGPVQDEFLGGVESQQGMVNGAIRRFSQALNGAQAGVAFTGAIISREIFPGGNTNYGMTPVVQGGHVVPGSFPNLFEEAQQARFIAEESVRRFTEANASREMLYQAHLWAGYAYRVLGEHWCEAVLDGGPLQPGSVYFDKGEEHFTSAIGFAPNETARLAAVAGRAQVRLWQGDFAGAVADASAVPFDFRFELPYDINDLNTHNTFFAANANLPYRTYTIHFTFQKDYYTATGDPRAEWSVNPDVPFANSSLQGFGQVPWSNQTKYRDYEAPIRLAGGPEMRLIQAEALLTQGNWQDALALINTVRTANVSDLTGQPLAPRTASSAAETWAHLKRERAIEMWLEGRHFGDQRRWRIQSTPGAFAIPDFESLSSLFTANPRSECFDIPESERNSNPNVPRLGG